MHRNNSLSRSNHRATGIASRSSVTISTNDADAAIVIELMKTISQQRTAGSAIELLAWMFLVLIGLFLLVMLMVFL